MSATLQDTLRRALALRDAGKAREAEALCDAVLTLDPANADGWQVAGLIRLDQGMNEAAREALAMAADLAPDIAGYHVNLATALQRIGKPEQAILSLERAIALQDDLPEAHYNLGNVLLEAGRSAEAEAAFERAALLRPDYAEALNNLGHLAAERGDAEAAVGYFRRARDAAPGYAPAWSNLCGSLLDLGRTVEAIEAGRRAVLLSPGSAKAHYNLGNAFAAAPIPAEAAACYRRALQIDPTYTDAFVNLGVAQMSLGDCSQAIAALDHALALDPDLADAQWNKALALLLSGTLGDGWDLYEWRWRAVKGLTWPQIDQPLWDGGDGAGRTLLILCEQGYGDAIQFVRYLRLVRRKNWRVVLECPPKLERLFAGAGLADSVIVSGARRPPFDSWLPIMSLPRAFATEIETIPAACPYLNAEPVSVAPADDSRLKVGIVWRGSLTNDRGRYRSCALMDLAPLRHMPGATFYSLQTDLSEEDRVRLGELAIPDLAAGLREFADTAPVVQSLDLVVTVDTAMAHLAGALGRPVWVLLSAVPDWRWLLDRDDSPWYPTMRLFRQQHVGDWASVVDEVAAALVEDCAGRGVR
jgi:tetratricopeptide (TPR) repeat protein